MTTQLTPKAIASTAGAFSRRSNACIRFVVCVTLWACSDGGFMAHSAPNVFPRVDRFQMIGVDAAPHSAKMVKLQVSRDSPLEQRICDPMRQQHFWPARLLYLSVAFLRQTSKPQPTAGFCNRHHLIDKTFSQCKLRSGHVTPFGPWSDIAGRSRALRYVHLPTVAPRLYRRYQTSNTQGVNYYVWSS